MTPCRSLEAVKISLGSLHFYIPASEVQRCSLVQAEMPDIKKFSQWLGLEAEPQQGMHLHLQVPASPESAGWYFWGELENVTLTAQEIFPLPALLQRCCQLPALKALVLDKGFSPLLSWASR
jgi:hypothetical protein